VRFENLLTRSFAIVRRKPWLWLLAFLAGQTSSAGGGSGGSSFQVQSRAPGSSPPDFSWLPQWLIDRELLFVEIGIAVLLVSLAWFLVSCVASGALVGAVARLDGGEPMTFGAAWRVGVASFGRVLAFKLLLLLAFLLPALLLVVPLLLGLLGGSRGLVIGFGLDLPLLFAYFYWAIFIGWLSELALRACVLEKLGAWAAFAAAWALPDQAVAGSILRGDAAVATPSQGQPAPATLDQAAGDTAGLDRLAGARAQLLDNARRMLGGGG